MKREGCLRALAAFALVGVAAGLLVFFQREWIEARVYLATMESKWRVDTLHVDRVVESLALSPGDRVADIGAGTGLFTRPIARAVAPAGTAYAVDINEKLLEHIEQSAAERGIPNIEAVLAQPQDPRLPGEIDLAFFCDAFHHVGDRAAYLRTLARYLAPEGRVAVIDFYSRVHVSPSMHYEVEDLDQWMADAGFELEEDLDLLEDNFFRIYRCGRCG